MVDWLQGHYDLVSLSVNKGSISYVLESTHDHVTRILVSKQLTLMVCWYQMENYDACAALERVDE